MTSPSFSDWIVYVDESGDHGISTIDPSFPVFVLVFALFHKSAYINRLVPPISSLKFRHFGHDGVILHERDIRKDLGPFSVLRDREKKEAFMEEISHIIERTSFEVVATVHDKRKIATANATIEHLYHQALRSGLERLHQRLHLSGASHPGTTHVVCESRGKKEDGELKVAFKRACDGENAHGCELPFDIVVTEKQANSVGLQVADLIARPIGLHVLRPEQANRAYDLVRAKLMPGPDGSLEWGLKCFP